MRRVELDKEIPAAAQEDDVRPENNTQEDVFSLISHLVNNLPPLPSCELTDPYDGVTLSRLMEALQDRHRIKQLMIDEYSKAADMVKSMIEEGDTSADNLINKQKDDLVEKYRIIQNNKAEIVSLERKIEAQELKINILRKTTQIYEIDKCLLQQELEAREQCLQREMSRDDNRHMRQHMDSVVTETELGEKRKRECSSAAVEMRAGSNVGPGSEHNRITTRRKL